MAKRILRKAYQKELAMEMRGNKKRKERTTTGEEFLKLISDSAARNTPRGDDV